MSIGMERVGSTYFMTLRVAGKLTHEDYQIITPTIESALSGVDVPEIHALIDGRELEGWELRASWDDFRLGVKHGKEFSKIAILGCNSLIILWYSHQRPDLSALIPPPLPAKDIS